MLFSSQIYGRFLVVIRRVPCRALLSWDEMNTTIQVAEVPIARKLQEHFAGDPGVASA
jgi:hypothetical protein